MSAARSMTLPSEVIMQPKPTVVTLSPGLPRTRYSIAGAAEPAWGCGFAGCCKSAERAADAAAGNASPAAARKLRREAVRFMGGSCSIFRVDIMVLAFQSG